MIGATGQQGGGLVRAILGDPQRRFVARRRAIHTLSAPVRSHGSTPRSLPPTSTTRLERAFDGAYGAFCVTFFWAHFSPEREITQARAMAAAARRPPTCDLANP